MQNEKEVIDINEMYPYKGKQELNNLYGKENIFNPNEDTIEGYVKKKLKEVETVEFNK